MVLAVQLCEYIVYIYHIYTQRERERELGTFKGVDFMVCELNLNKTHTQKIKKIFQYETENVNKKRSYYLNI